MTWERVLVPIHPPTEASWSSWRGAIPQKYVRDDKKHRKHTAEVKQQMIIPGMVRVECQRIGLGTLGAGIVVRRVGHGGSERVSIIKN
jgi:hypothetical protein